MPVGHPGARRPTTGWPTRSPGNGSSGPITSASGDRLGVGSGRRPRRRGAPARRRTARARGRPRPRRSTSASRCAPQNRGASMLDTPSAYGAPALRPVRGPADQLVRPLDHRPAAAYRRPHAAAARDPPLRARRGLRPGARRGRRRRARAPATALPSERRLAEVLGVSRPAVREALQRMAQTRLLDVRHGGATTVRDFRQVRRPRPAAAAAGARRRARPRGRPQHARGPARRRPRRRRPGRRARRPRARGRR